MKHLVGCLKSKPLSGPVIQSVFDHSRLFIGDSFHMPLFGSVLAQQTIEVFVAAHLTAAIWIGKVGLDAKCLIDGLVIRKLLAVVQRQSLYP
jgi:hypothetical protein